MSVNPKPSLSKQLILKLYIRVIFTIYKTFSNLMFNVETSKRFKIMFNFENWSREVSNSFPRISNHKNNLTANKKIVYALKKNNVSW